MITITTIFLYYLIKLSSAYLATLPHDLSIFIPGLVYATQINGTVTVMSSRKIFKATSEHFRQDAMHILANNLFALIDDSSNIDEKMNFYLYQPPSLTTLHKKNSTK